MRVQLRPTRIEPPTASARRATLETLEAGRFLASFLVVLYHCNLLSSYPKYMGFEALPAFRGGYSGVEFFFVLSGFVIFHVHRQDIAMQSGTLPFLLKRFRRLYPPLWAVVLPLALAMLAVPQLRFAGSLSPYDIVSAILVTPAEREHVLAVEWTLRYEILFYLCTALLMWRRPVGLVAWSMLLACAVASLFLPAPSWPFRFAVTPYPLLFAGGAAAALLLHDRHIDRPAWLLAAGLALFGATFAYCAGTEVYGHVSNATKLGFGAGAVLIVLGAVELERRGALPVPGWLRLLGAASYAIYLVHFPVASLLARGAAILYRLGIPAMPLMLAVALTASAAGVLFHLLIERPLLVRARRFRVRPV